jgi:hypothetical protein
MGYTGWLRTLPRGRWRLACAALTWAGCWDRLLAVRADSERCEKVVLPRGTLPIRVRR